MAPIPSDATISLTLKLATPIIGADRRKVCVETASFIFVLHRGESSAAEVPNVFVSCDVYAPSAGVSFFEFA